MPLYFLRNFAPEGRPYILTTKEKKPRKKDFPDVDFLAYKFDPEAAGIPEGSNIIRKLIGQENDPDGKVRGALEALIKCAYEHGQATRPCPPDVM